MGELVTRESERNVLAEDGDAAQDASLRLESALREGAEAQHRLAPVLTLIEERRRLVDTERRRLLAGEKAIRIDELMNLMAAVVDVIRRHVPDRKARRAISDEIRLLIGDGPPN